MKTIETASSPVLPSLTAPVTGPRSRWSTACEQYLDRSSAGIIEPRPGQDQISPALAQRGPAQSVNPAMVAIERMAPGLVRLARPTRSPVGLHAAEPEHKREVVISGWAARAWEDEALLGVMCAYCPASWHHPAGIQKVLRRIMPFLPDVTGALFLTLTFDRNLFADPGSAHDHGRPLIRKIMDQLRKGVLWNGKRIQIDGAYCVKLEFHEDEDGWPHYHLIILTRRHLPVALLAEMWGNGFCKVRRITNADFHYLLSYVTKGNGEYPAWAKPYRRLRIFQPSHGFMLPRPAQPPPAKPRRLPSKPKRATYTIGERLERWSRMALFNQGGKYFTVRLAAPFRRIFDQLILSIAEGKRYLGNGFIKINHRKELIPWILNPLTL